LRLRKWTKAVRPAFIPASVIPVFAGWALAGHPLRPPDMVYLGATLLGVALAHMSADLFNEYFDFKNGTDRASEARGLSGGMGILVRGMLEPESVKRAGFVLLSLASLVGIILGLERGPVVLLFMAFGGVTVYMYTSTLQRKGLGELTLAVERILTTAGSAYVFLLAVPLSSLIVGASLGALSVFTVYYAAFPDYEADSETGKKTLVVLLGKDRARRLALLPVAAGYLFLLFGLAAGVLGLYPLATLLLVPFFIHTFTKLRGNMVEGLREAALLARLFGVTVVLLLLL
jgi:1,4-dihydroxy-2-naphthoate octaprenyltransferase